MNRDRVKLAKTSSDDLPDDCWEFIIGRVDGAHRHLRPISTVSKRFLTITGRLHTSLTLSPPSLSSHLPRVYSRFPNLASLHLSRPHPDLDGFLRELAGSGLRLQSLRLSRQTTFPRRALRLFGEKMRASLKSLLFYQLQWWVTDDDLLVIGDCFSYLHHLDLDLLPRIPVQDRLFLGGITDAGLCAISAKLVSLISLTISLYHHEQSLACFSSNCPRLSRLRAVFCVPVPAWIEQFSSFTGLSYLRLHHVTITDTGLDQMSTASLNVTKLVLDNPKKSVTTGAMCRFLKSCRSLAHLKLMYTRLTSDGTAPSDIVSSIPNVEAIHLCNVNFVNTFLYDMLESCPNLSEIVLTMTSVAMVDYIYDHPIHHGLRRLVFTGNGLCDEIVALIGSICPNLESFYFADHDHVTEQGTEAMKAKCCNIKICKRIRDYVWREESDSEEEED